MASAPSTSSSAPGNTAFYLDCLHKVFTYMSTISVIDEVSYPKIINFMPMDLAARLRLVPDERLSPRLAHLADIYWTINSNDPIGNVTDYSILSIEGSETTFPFDCDLVIEDNKTAAIYFVDFTASNSAQIINSKYETIKQNIDVNKYKNAYSFVKRFKPRKIAVDIKSIFSSAEPGTTALKFLDSLSRFTADERLFYLNNCREVYERVNRAIALQDNTKPPGDYKTTAVPKGLLDDSIQLVSTQKDRETLKYLKTCAKLDPQYYPYLSGLEDLLAKAQKFKPLVRLEGAEVFETKELVANLACLVDDWLAKALHAACLTDNVVAIGESDDVNILADFPGISTDGILAEPTLFKVAVKQIKAHKFKIVFSRNYMDSKMKNYTLKGQPRKDKSFTADFKKRTGKVATVDDYIHEAIRHYENDVDYFNSISLSKPKDSVWNKILTISSLASNDLENFGRSTTSMLDAYVATMSQTYAGSCLAHDYEVNKSILASLKISPAEHEYYVGVNGSFKSITIVKMSSTLDSFSRCSYCVVYKAERDSSNKHVRIKGSTTRGVLRTHFYSSDPNQLSHSLKLPFIITSLATWEIENNMQGRALSNGVLAQLMIDTMFVSLVNRDQFAQSAEQIRYFYMASIGYGGSAPDIVEKATFMFTRHHFEVLYLMRSFKVAACLTSISCSGMLSAIDDKETGELAVAFPHTNFPSKSFSQTISSMYVCNVYNKFRSFHEVSEAMCFNAIMEERNIYHNRVSEDKYAVSGLTPKAFEAAIKGDGFVKNYIFSKNFIEEEVAFSVRLAQVKSKRYSGSASYIVGAAAKHAVLPKATLDGIYENLNKAPIDAVTMRGSMDEGPSTENHQGIRAASAVLEEVVREAEMDPKLVNSSGLNSVYLMDKLQLEKPTFSIISCVMKQFSDGSVVYRYRIVQKDQKGHREISVLNFPFRIGALFVETIAREVASINSETDICHNHNKDKIIEDTIQATFKKDKVASGSHCYDNSDQKRWGPNHNMNFFAFVMFVVLMDDMGLFRLCNRVYDLTMDKRAKYPESLVDLIVKKNAKSSASDPINNFIKFATPKINAKIYEELMAAGMCQGIYQDGSSLNHAIFAKAKIDAMKEKYPDVTLSYMVTSDDAEGLMHIPRSIDKVLAVKESHSIGLKIGNLINIVRSNPKSAFNFRIAELNSLFFKKGVMATPSLKQRIAKIDVGNGMNHIEDFLSVQAAAASYLASGGSYMGATILTILNFTLHTEQWLRWNFAKSDNYYKPVEFGGFPVIEPISAILSGGISNFYQRVSSIVSAEKYSRLVVNSLLCPPEAVSLEDFSRSGSDRVKKTFHNESVTIVKGTGPLGIFQMVRTDRKLSQFERRHKINSWIIPEEFASLRRDSPIASNFIFSIFRNTSVTTLETNVGVNSFFVRMAEPWASYKRNCMRVSEHSPFAEVFKTGNSMISHEELTVKLMGLTLAKAAYELILATRRTERKSEFEIMENQLTVRFNDAQSIKVFLASQEAEDFKKPRVSPSIQEIVLRGHTAADSDAYLLAIIKTMSGKLSEPLINDYKRSLHAYSSVEVAEPKIPLPLVTSVTLADGALALYGKFIRKSTKMIIPNKVDDLRSLCLDIISNKFTEALGMITEGTLDLDPERARPYAHSNWYQKLIDESQTYETWLANSILIASPSFRPKTGIISKRNLITRNDTFEFGPTTISQKTVLVDCKSKDSFVNTMRTWVSAKVNFTFTRDTIDALLKGRLTFAHDYYAGDNRFFRYAKNKYLTITIGGNKGLHMIQTKINNKNGKRSTSYRHTFIFGADVGKQKVEANVNSDFTKESWVAKLSGFLNNISEAEVNKWHNIPKGTVSNPLSFRKTEEETDFVIFRVLKPGMELELTSAANSLCLFLQTRDFSFPISYLNPTSVDNLNIGFTLKHSDLVIATNCYVKLRNITTNFSRSRISSWPDLEEAFNFVLTGSTTDTPNYIINKILFKFIATNIDSTILDIIRTFLIRNPAIGLGYSSSRFSQYLLNMGVRRRHEHSYLCRTIMGARADNDSEDWDVMSAEEDLLLTGKSNPHELQDIEEEEEIRIPEYLKPLGGGVDSEISSLNAGDPQDAMSAVGSWAEEVINNELINTPADPLDTTTAEAYDLWDDSGDDQGTDEGNAAAATSKDEDDPSDSRNDSISNVTLPSKPAATPADDGSAIDAINNMFSSIDYTNIFDMDVDSDDEGEPGSNQAPKPSTLDDLFRNAIGGTYDRVVDSKDKGLQSERTGHTVSPSLENARTFIEYLSEWLKTSGSSRDFDDVDSLPKDVSGVTGLYLTFHSVVDLNSTNLLEKFFGLDNLVLPVTLSALSIVSSTYN